MRQLLTRELADVNHYRVNVTKSGNGPIGVWRVEGKTFSSKSLILRAGTSSLKWKTQNRPWNFFDSIELHKETVWLIRTRAASINRKTFRDNLETVPSVGPVHQTPNLQAITRIETSKRNLTALNLFRRPKALAWSVSGHS